MLWGQKFIKLPSGSCLIARSLVLIYKNSLTSISDLNVDPRTGNYFPSIYFNEFWLLREKVIAINETVKELPLHLEVGPISMNKWQLFLQIDQSFQIHRSYGSMLEGEADELKVLVMTSIFSNSNFGVRLLLLLICS